VLVMAVVTYIPRALPLTLMRRQVQNRFVQSVLFYMPYAVLGAMIFPSVLEATATPWSALAGVAVALVLSWLRLYAAAGGSGIHGDGVCSGMADENSVWSRIRRRGSSA